MSNIVKIEVRISGAAVGHAALNSNRLCAFEYSKEWLASGYSISPFELPLKEGVMLAKPTPFHGDFGVFDDALPDGWGMLLLDRYLRLHGINPSSLTLLDLMTYVGASGRGALEFYPDKSTLTLSETNNLESLCHHASELLKTDDYLGEGIEELWQSGGSPGGTRPKVFIRHGGKEWLVKFPAHYDPIDIGEKEYVYSCLARRCGIDMPETRLFEGKYFGVERFDRGTNGERYHTITAAGLLQADYRIPSIDYLHLMKLTRLLTGSEAELWRMFRLMTFNYLIGNKDDHAKNFSFIYRGGEWRLAPAYDLLPSEGLNGYHTTAFNNSIRPTDSDLVSIASASGLNENKARQILDEMRFILKQKEV